MIPKKIHYIWVGPNPMPEKNQLLLEKNKKKLKEFDIKLWTEKEIDLSNRYIKIAYEKKKWAFVSDYARFKILMEEGGIYLDTDMEILKPIEHLLNVPAFAGENRKRNSVYCGVIGATAGHSVIKRVIELYDELEEGDWLTSPDMLTRAVQSVQKNDFLIHPFYTFYPVDEGETPKKEFVNRALAVHHWDESWRRFVPMRKALRRVGVIKLYHLLTGK